MNIDNELTDFVEALLPRLPAATVRECEHCGGTGRGDAVTNAAREVNIDEFRASLLLAIAVGEGRIEYDENRILQPPKENTCSS